MRRVATGMLVAMASVFVVARYFQGAHPAWEWVLAFSEAAMGGGLADWFAVTALFRRPLGLPIPHTAIIPENKDRIADTMATFLRQNFLTPQVVARRMMGMNLAAAAGEFLANPRTGESRLRDGALGMMGDVLESLDPEQLGGMVKQGLRGQLEKLDVAPLLGQMLSAAIADRRHLPVMESILRWAALTLEDNEELVRSLIHERANAILRWTGLDEKLANAVLDGLYKLLAETIVDPDHRLRRKVEEGLETLARDLVHDPAMHGKVAALKHELLADPAVGAWLDAMWERMRASLLQAVRNPDAALATGLGATFGQAAAELGGALRDDRRLQRLINRFARRTLVGIVNRYGAQIVRLVSETVKRWDASTVTLRIEGAVGRDLQFIRINGTLVGGLFGLVIHAAGLLL
ncbi:MAG: DUF445 domain-containing protein [Sphingomonadales bacterium]|nr:DUF445 domain-containing protein [Sphingomonadales bacterium]